MIELKKITESEVPIAMFVGNNDILATPSDAQWTRDQLGKNIVKYEEKDNMDHEAFNYGKDTDFISEVVDLISHYV